jgi:hypothetical protein
MPARPGGPLATRPLHFIWIADCSGSMAHDGKIQALNTAIRDTIPHMRRVAEEFLFYTGLAHCLRTPTWATWRPQFPALGQGWQKGDFSRRTPTNSERKGHHE